MKNKINVKRLTIKLILCVIYFIIITILLVGSYKQFEKEKEIIPWNEVETTEEYSYIEISKMSEKFAYYENKNIGLHFVIETDEKTGIWHTYVIAINEKYYNNYKKIIDYSYERTTEVPDKIKVYGYPTIMSDELKQMIVKNIGNFLPAENQTVIDIDNMEEYLTNSYLDTTVEKKDEFNVILFITLLLLFSMIGLLIYTIFAKEKKYTYSDEISFDIIDEEEYLPEKVSNRRK